MLFGSFRKKFSGALHHLELCSIAQGKLPNLPQRGQSTKKEVTHCMERLLKLLEENARLSVEELAAMLSISPEEVAAQMDDYAKKGVIRGYRAMVDWEKVSTDKVQAVM